MWQSKYVIYQASGDNFKEVASNNGASKLSDPVENAGKNSDLATNSQSKSNSGVNMATGDVGSNSNRNKQSQSVTDCNGNQSRWIKCSIGCNLCCLHQNNKKSWFYKTEP